MILIWLVVMISYVLLYTIFQLVDRLFFDSFIPLSWRKYFKHGWQDFVLVYVGWLHLVLITHNAIEWEPTIGVLLGVEYLCLSALMFVLIGIVRRYVARRAAHRLTHNLQTHEIVIKSDTSADHDFVLEGSFSDKDGAQ